MKARFGRGAADPAAWAVGEDSGIEAAALDGEPGVHTARWAAGDPVGRMLGCARRVEEGRRARYVCVHRRNRARRSRGRDARDARGRRSRSAASGDEGFGFDPVFVPDGETATVAELGDAWKRDALASRPRRRGARGRLPPSVGRAASGHDRASRAVVGEHVVERRAEHDHVRHHVEPHEQEERRSERLERDDVRGEDHEQRERLERRREHDRAEDRPREHLAPREPRVRQPVVGREEEQEEREPGGQQVSPSATQWFATTSVA